MNKRLQILIYKYIYDKLPIFNPISTIWQQFLIIFREKLRLSF